MQHMKPTLESLLRAIIRHSELYEQLPAIPGKRQSPMIYNARECYRGAMNF